ncbi:MAG: hypothetical protein ACFFDI_23590 [Promethearchaeota archaeon]
MKNGELIESTDPDLTLEKPNLRTNWYKITEKGKEYLDNYLKSLLGNFFQTLSFSTINEVKYVAYLVELLNTRTVLNYIYELKSFRDVPILSIISRILQEIDVTHLIMTNTNSPKELSDITTFSQTISGVLEPVPQSVAIIICFDLFFVPFSEFRPLRS